MTHPAEPSSNSGMRTLRPALTPLFALAALLVAGCGSRFSTYCSAEQQCVGGNSKDISACEDEAQAEMNVASDYGCGDAANQFADCINQKFSCSTGTGACSNQATAMSACECAASSNCNRVCPASCSASRDFCCSGGIQGCC